MVRGEDRGCLRGRDSCGLRTWRRFLTFRFMTPKGTMSDRVSTNASNLFQILRDGQPRTRAELVSATGFARATITARIESLMATGLISPVTEAASTGGRPSARVAFNPEARVVGAADVGATHAVVALGNLSGRILVQQRKELSIASGPEIVLDWLVDVFQSLLAQLNRPVGDMVAVGIGLPGPVEHATGKPSSPPIMPGWDAFDVPRYVQRSFAIPVLVDNDVNVMALGERASCWPTVQNMIFLKVATGIGSGLISGGALQRGADGTAGDVGHIAVTRAAGVRCRCGNVGCLEAIAGGPAVAASLRQEGLPTTNGADVVDLVRAGDINAIAAVRQAGRDIGEMLSMCVSLINPALIVVGGSMAQSGEHLLAGIRETVYAASTPLATQHLSIEQSRTGQEAGVLGAAILAIDYALAPERIDDLAETTPSEQLLSREAKNNSDTAVAS